MAEEQFHGIVGVDLLRQQILELTDDLLPSMLNDWAFGAIFENRIDILEFLHSEYREWLPKSLLVTATFWGKIDVVNCLLRVNRGAVCKIPIPIMIAVDRIHCNFRPHLTQTYVIIFGILINHMFLYEPQYLTYILTCLYNTFSDIKNQCFEMIYFHLYRRGQRVATKRLLTRMLKLDIFKTVDDKFALIFPFHDLAGRDLLRLHMAHVEVPIFRSRQWTHLLFQVYVADSDIFKEILNYCCKYIQFGCHYSSVVDTPSLTDKFFNPVSYNYIKFIETCKPGCVERYYTQYINHLTIHWPYVSCTRPIRYLIIFCWNADPLSMLRKAKYHGLMCSLSVTLGEQLTVVGPLSQQEQYRKHIRERVIQHRQPGDILDEFMKEEIDLPQVLVRQLCFMSWCSLADIPD